MTEYDFEMATARLHNLSDIIDGLTTDIFSCTLNGITEKKNVGRNETEKVYINCHDWMILNYDLVANILNDMKYTFSDMLDIIENEYYKIERAKGQATE